METSSFEIVNMESKVTFHDKVETIKERSCIIEFQAFRGNNDEYIVKELVILDLLTYVIYPFLFKPPFSFNKLNSKSKRTNKWIIKNFHHIGWREGHTDYKDLENIMYHYCSRFTKIYTRGLEKRNWIQLFTTKDVVEVKLDNTVDFEINNICILTKSEKHALSQCAIKNVYRLAAFLNGGYKYGEEEETRHQYYSRLRQDNTSHDGFTGLSTSVGAAV